MKLLILIDGLGCGGKERQAVELASGLVQSGLLAAGDVRVLSMSAPGHYDEVLTKAGIGIDRVLRRWRWDPLPVVLVRRTIRAWNPDLIFSFSLMTTLFAIGAKPHSGAVFADGSIRDASPSRGFERLLHRIGFTFADVVVSNSQAGLVAKGAPAKKSRVLYNGFDYRRVADLPSPAAIRGSLGLGAGPAVGMVASFSRSKDWSTFLDAAAQIRSFRPDVSILAVGGGERFAHFKRHYQGAGIVFTGRRGDAEALMQCLDVGVLCTDPRYHREGIPNVVIEYMALGKPCVVTDGGGVRELVVDDETGLIVPPGHPDAVAAAVLSLLSAPNAAAAMGVAGRRRIIENFSIARAVERLWDIHERALATTPVGSDAQA